MRKMGVKEREMNSCQPHSLAPLSHLISNQENELPNNLMSYSPPSLEQSYRQRKKEKAVLLFRKVFENHRGKGKFFPKLQHVCLAF